MKFVILEKGTTPKTLPHLLQAAEKLNLETIVLNANSCSDQEVGMIKDSTEPYLMYAIVDTAEHFPIEAELFTKYATTFYTKTETIFSCRDKSVQSVLFQKNGLTFPKTSLICNENNLQETIDDLGGFPLLIKTNYGQRGVGVIRIDSFEGLSSTLDFLKTQNVNYFLQEFIEMDYYVRTVIVGDRVLGNIRYDVPENDFRLTSMKNLKPQAVEIPNRVIQESLKAMKLLDVEFAGIDFLVKGTQYYISEINYPCIYLNSQELIKENISEEILKYLINKQKRSN